MFDEHQPHSVLTCKSMMVLIPLIINSYIIMNGTETILHYKLLMIPLCQQSILMSLDSDMII